MPSLATPSATFDRLLAAVINGGNPGSPGWSELAAVMASYRARKSGDPGAARTLAAVPGPLSAAPARVPCHLDFQPRNWLLGPAADLYLVDFEHARTDLPLRDLVRLRFRIWQGRPDLKDAFLNGYGRDITGPDTETLQHLGALDALTAIARGHQNHDIQLIQHAQSTLRQLRVSG